MDGTSRPLSPSPHNHEAHIRLLHPALIIPTFPGMKGVLSTQYRPNTTSLLQAYSLILPLTPAPTFLLCAWCQTKGSWSCGVNCLCSSTLQRLSTAPLSHTLPPGTTNCSSTQCGCSAHIILCGTWTRENAERPSGDGSVAWSEPNGSPTLQPDVCTWQRMPCPAAVVQHQIWVVHSLAKIYEACLVSSKIHIATVAENVKILFWSS